MFTPFLRCIHKCLTFTLDDRYADDSIHEHSFNVIPAANVGRVCFTTDHGPWFHKDPDLDQ